MVLDSLTGMWPTLKLPDAITSSISNVLLLLVLLPILPDSFGVIEGVLGVLFAADSGVEAGAEVDSRPGCV